MTFRLLCVEQLNTACETCGDLAIITIAVVLGLFIRAVPLWYCSRLRRGQQQQALQHRHKRVLRECVWSSA